MVGFALAGVASLLATQAPTASTPAGQPSSVYMADAPAPLSPALELADGLLLAADDASRIFLSRDGGRSWNQAQAGLPAATPRRAGRPLLAGVASEPATAYALLRWPLDSHRVRSTLYRTRDAGRSWAAIKTIPGGETIVALRVSQAGLVELVPADGPPMLLRDRAPTERRGRLERPIRRLARVPVPQRAATPDYDDADIAVIHDDGTLVSVNDLAGRRLRFRREAGGTYRVDPLPALPLAAVGSPLPLVDEARAMRALPFAFPFFGGSFSDVWVSDNGNLTLGAADPDFDFEESPQQLVDGPPRIAALWDDLDPDAGGSVLFDATPTAVTVTWLDLPQFGAPSSERNTFQAVLEPDGAITLAWASPLPILDGLTGIAPGAGVPVALSDLSLDPTFRTTSGPSGPEGVLQIFSDRYQSLRIAQRFFDCHADVYDQLVIYAASGTPYPVVGESGFGFAVMARNDIAGIGLSGFDFSGLFGSAGVLRGTLGLAALDAFPDDPTLADIRGYAPYDTSSLDVLAQEVAHTWGAYVSFDDDPLTPGTCEPNLDLLAGASTNWSFYHHTRASVLLGNNFEDNFDGTWLVLGEARARFSPLDRYLMGLLPAPAVPPFYFIADPMNAGDCLAESPFCSPDSLPEIGVTVDAGMRRNVTVDQVISCNGPRFAGTGVPTPLRQAWLLLVPPGATASPADISKIKAFQAAWAAPAGYFETAAGPGAAVDVTLLGSTAAPSGGVGPNLRLRKSADSAVLVWAGGDASPARYNVHGTDDLTLLPDAILAALAPLFPADTEAAEDRAAVPPGGRPSPFYYKVFGRDCTDASVVP